MKPRLPGVRGFVVAGREPQDREGEIATPFLTRPCDAIAVPGRDKIPGDAVVVPGRESMPWEADVPGLDSVRTGDSAVEGGDVGAGKKPAASGAGSRSISPNETPAVIGRSVAKSPGMSSRNPRAESKNARSSSLAAGDGNRNAQSGTVRPVWTCGHDRPRREDVRFFESHSSRWSGVGTRRG